MTAVAAVTTAAAATAAAITIIVNINLRSSKHALNNLF